MLGSRIPMAEIKGPWGMFWMNGNPELDVMWKGLSFESSR
jgi:hypothetical protein